MSLTISAGSFLPPPVEIPAPRPVPTPTTGEDVLQLASGGQSAQQIASDLGLQLAQVDASLGVPSTPGTQAIAVAALNPRLSVLA